MSSSERSIPHLRDIFGLSSYSSSISSKQQQQDPNLHIEEKEKGGSKKGKKSKTNSQNSNPHGEIKTLERHLSMKKTIRKKIMRDLQQAFVDDPNEFKIDSANNQDRLKAELNLEALRFGDGNSNHRSRKSDNFLDMLRGEQQQQQNVNSNANLSSRRQNEENFDHYSATNNNNPNSPQLQSANEKQSFWSRFGIRNKNKR